MAWNAVRWGAAVGITLLLGAAFVPLGCGGSSEGGAAAVPEQHSEGKLPEGVAQQLKVCAAERGARLGSARHSVSFNVTLARDGQVDAVSLRKSTLGDPELEACMASVLRSLSEDDLPLRRAENRPGGPDVPESRALLGQAETLLLLELLVLAGAAYITVQIYVLATRPSSAAKPKPRTAPIATTMPTEDVDKLKYEKICWPFFEECMNNQDQPAWNRKDFGETKDCGACLRDCKNHSKGEWPVEKCPPK